MGEDKETTRMDAKTILRRADNVTFEIVADEAILIDMNSGTYFSLNAVGTIFWEEVDGQKSLSKIAREVTDFFNNKARQFGVELSELAQSASSGQAQVAQLAMSYDMEEEMVAEFLATLKAGNRQLDALVSDLLVEVDGVTADLLELAQTMVGEKLLVAQ
jgi:hypothetical protein